MICAGSPAEFNQPNVDALQVALARDSVRVSALLTKVRERLKIPTAAELARGGSRAGRHTTRGANGRERRRTRRADDAAGRLLQSAARG